MGSQTEHLPQSELIPKTSLQSLISGSLYRHLKGSKNPSPSWLRWLPGSRLVTCKTTPKCTRQETFNKNIKFKYQYALWLQCGTCCNGIQEDDESSRGCDGASDVQMEANRYYLPFAFTITHLLTHECRHKNFENQRLRKAVSGKREIYGVLTSPLWQAGNLLLALNYFSRGLREWRLHNYSKTSAVYTLPTRLHGERN